MPIELESDWGRKRRAHMTKRLEIAKDIILHCLTPEDDEVFARKWHYHKGSVQNIRLGLRQKKLRKKLRPNE